MYNFQTKRPKKKTMSINYFFTNLILDYRSRCINLLLSNMTLSNWQISDESLYPNNEIYLSVNLTQEKVFF